MKLPDRYYKANCYWAHMLTFRCSSSCSFCILNGRGRRVRSEEMSGDDILNFWNNIEHSDNQRLSLIGGEPTLHKDIIKIVNGLENYKITITTNCGSPFFDDPDFYTKFNPHPTSSLRINTTFHPNHISPSEYIKVINRLRSTGYLVDQTSYVYYPGIEKYKKEIELVNKEIKIKATPYLGFYNEGDKFTANFSPENIQPNHCQSTYPNCKKKSNCTMDLARTICGISNLDAYKDICGQQVGKEVTCEHPLLSLIISPDGKYYHCHYKLYYDIDPVCDIKNFTTVDEHYKNCRHYGLCNWCDVPRVGCAKNKTAKDINLNKLFDKVERSRPEITYLFSNISRFAKDNNLECNVLKWFEYSYSLLYSGHKKKCKVLDVGSARSVFPYYLSSKGYDVTTLDIADMEYRKKIGMRYNVTSLDYDLKELKEDLIGKFDFITCLSVIEHIDDDTKAIINLSKYLKPNGVIVISTDFYERYIEYPDANRTIVTDRPEGTHTDSRVYTPSDFFRRIIDPLEENGLKRIGETNFNNVNIKDPSERCVRGLYTFGISMLRKI